MPNYTEVHIDIIFVNILLRPLDLRPRTKPIAKQSNTVKDRT